MIHAVEHAQAPSATVQAVRNHLTLAEQWDVLDLDGFTTDALLSPETTVIDASALPSEALVALTAAVA